MARLILLDRDGVLNVDSPDFVKDADEWLAIPGSVEAVARLKASGFLVAVCSNQSGVGRGLLDEAALERIHRKLGEALAAQGASLDALRYCPHHPDAGCSCRKPRPGMLLELMAEFRVDPQATIMVGDAIRDVEAAHAAGCHAALVRTGHGASVEPIARAMGVRWIGDDLAAFAEWATGTRAW